MSKQSEGHCCAIDVATSSVRQTLDEMDFERGIWFAAQQNDTDKVENLLRKGVSINVEDTSGYTALHYAARNGHFLLTKILLEKGAKVDVKTRSGQATPIHRASSQGHVAIVELLLKYGANPDAKDSDGYTAFHRAIKANSLAVCKILIDKCDVTIVDNRGMNIKTFACKFGNKDINDLINEVN